ncbi:MAG TPA: hypothetical protein VGH81_00465 [Rudaea sp.]|jgi:site-specific recombinase
MNMKPIIFRNIALMLVFGAVGLTMFTENVRAVQIVGLLGCGGVFGAALTTIVFALRSKQRKE